MCHSLGWKSPLKNNYFKVCFGFYFKTNFFEDFYYILSYTIHFLPIHIA